MPGAASGSERNSSPSGLASSIGSEPSWPRWARATTTLFSEVGAAALASFAQHSVIRCPPMHATKLSACSIALSYYSPRSLHWNVSGTLCLRTKHPDKAGQMIQHLASLRGIGAQSATVLVREAFVRGFANGKALGSYAGLSATPFNSGSVKREQGIGKAGNRRLRTVMIELAWLWQRYQPGSALVHWYREPRWCNRNAMRKVMIVALARKLLIALWRFVTQGVVPEGTTMKPAS